MPYVQRNNGKVTGLFANKQDGYAEEYLEDDAPELLALRSAERMDVLRDKRNSILASTDYTQLADFQKMLTEEQQAAWAEYRQQLRDLPQTVDPEAPVFPLSPGV